MSLPRTRRTPTSRPDIDVPPQPFMAWCDRNGVVGPDRNALWAVHGTSGLADDEAGFDGLLEDYRHWLLYRAARTGDADAVATFERFWRAHALAFFRSRFSAADAEELVARFFERVYRLVDGPFAPACPFSAYLRTILVNLARDYVAAIVKRRGREVSLSSAAGAAAHVRATGDPSPEEAVLTTERVRALRAALWELAPRDRLLVIACLLDGHSPESQAERLSLSREAVYQRLHRARRRLRQLLERDGLA